MCYRESLRERESNERKNKKTGIWLIWILTHVYSGNLWLGKGRRELGRESLASIGQRIRDTKSMKQKALEKKKKQHEEGFCHKMSDLELRSPSPDSKTDEWWMAALADMFAPSQESVQLFNYWAPEGCYTISENHFFNPLFRRFLGLLPLVKTFLSPNTFPISFLWETKSTYLSSVASACPFSHPSPPIYPLSWLELSNFNHCVLLKSLQRPKALLKSLSPPTEHGRHPKYL